VSSSATPCTQQELFLQIGLGEALIVIKRASLGRRSAMCSYQTPRTPRRCKIACCGIALTAFPLLCRCPRHPSGPTAQEKRN
jgi:hypothetical protein